MLLQAFIECFLELLVIFVIDIKGFAIDFDRGRLAGTHDRLDRRTALQAGHVVLDKLSNFLGATSMIAKIDLDFVCHG